MVYVITALSIFLAIMLFVSGRKYYIIHPHKGSYMTDTCKIIWQGLKRIQFRNGESSKVHWLDKAKESTGGLWSEERVEDVKSLLRIVPIFLTFILYWTIYGQVSWSLLITYFENFFIVLLNILCILNS